MTSRHQPASEERRRQLDDMLRREISERRASYRDQALRLFPHVCASCGREFEGRRLRELTVHHKDHDHDNNPPDGSNWELLCLYCHDHEHEKHKMKGFRGRSEDAPTPSVFQPFAGLDLGGLALASDDESEGE